MGWVAKTSLVSGFSPLFCVSVFRMVHRFRQLDAKVLVFHSALGDVPVSDKADSGSLGK